MKLGTMRLAFGFTDWEEVHLRGLIHSWTWFGMLLLWALRRCWYGMRFLGTLRGSKCVLHAGVIQVTGSQSGSCDGQLPGSLVSSFSYFILCLVSVSMAVSRHHDCGSSYKGKHLIWMAHSFRGSVHHRHGGKHDSMQADMVLGK